MKVGKTMGDEVESQAKKVQAVHDSLASIDINKLVVDEKLDESALKERLVSLVLPVMKKYQNMVFIQHTYFNSSLDVRVWDS